MDAGVFGVDLFFTLSSFLITRLLLAEQAAGQISVRNFYIRRALRIWPLYFTFLAASLALAHFAHIRDIGWAYWLTFFTFTGNWACAFWGYPSSYIFPLWSVGVEEQFYLAWPLCIKFLGRRTFVGMCAAIFTMSMAVKAGLALSGAVHPAAWCNTFGRLEPIALGALLACHKSETLPASEPVLWLRLLLALVIVVIANVFFPWNHVTLGSGLITYPLVALASAVFIGTAMHSSSLRRVLSIRPLVYLGRISYGLYVFHIGSLYLSDAMFSHMVRNWGGATLLRPAIAFTITILFAVISYELMEKYFLRLKLRFTRIESRPGG